MHFPLYKFGCTFQTLSTSQLLDFLASVDELIMASQSPIEDLTKNMSSLLSSDKSPEQAEQLPPASNSEDAAPPASFSRTPFAYNTIPSRVKQHVPLKVTSSSIPGAGRGLFVLKDVAAGDLLFTIPFPALNIVSQSTPPLEKCAQKNCNLERLQG
jgi:hypothetical protein